MPTIEAASGGADPTVLPLLPDAIQALVALGRLDDAERLAALLEGRRPGHTWAQAVGARCRGLLLAARGACDEARAALQRSGAIHDRLPRMRYDRARTLLVLGLVQRRCNQRLAARASLQEADRLFAEVGATRWADNARAELERLGLRQGSGDELTPAEEQVAELASSGMTVREVAAALIISPKTVEAHLTRIYRKLGIRSRAELGRLMAGRTRAEPSA
jgi:DNA-binding CsgD family transcriptional regulator